MKKVLLFFLERRSQQEAPELKMDGPTNFPIPPDNPALDAVFTNQSYNVVYGNATDNFKHKLPPVVAQIPNYKPPPTVPKPDLVKYLKACPPVHRVDADVFTEYILLKKELCARSVLEDIKGKSMRDALARTPSNVGNLSSSGSLTPGTASPGGSQKSLKQMIADSPNTFAVVQAVQNAPDDDPDKHTFQDQIDFVFKLRAKQPGLNVTQDIKLGTTTSVFATLGFNNHNVNGGVVIILSQALVHHPGTTISPCAGTSFLSKRAFHHQPWQLLHLLNRNDYPGTDAELKQKIITQAQKTKENAKNDFPEITDDMAIDCYMRSLLHPSQEGWAEFAALQLEFAAQLSQIKSVCHPL